MNGHPIFGKVRDAIGGTQTERYRAKEDLRYFAAKLLLPHLPDDAVLLPTKKGITIGFAAPECMLEEWRKLDAKGIEDLAELEVMLLKFAELKFEELPEQLVSFDPVVHVDNSVLTKEGFVRVKKEKKEGSWGSTSHLRADRPRARRDRRITGERKEDV